MRNSEIIQKADFVLADLAAGGLLNPQQTDQFIRTLIDQPTILAVCRTVAMKSPEMKVNKIGFGSRILQAAVENTYAANTVSPDLGQVILNTSEVIAEVHLTYDVIEDNIEGGNVNTPLQTGAGGIHQTIVDLIAERAALDLEELAINGNTTSADPYLAMQNGFLALATANTVNVGSVFDKDAVKQALKTMPTKYLRNRSALQHFVSVDNETEIRDQYASRNTPLGDQNVQGTLPVYIFGSKVTPVAMMPGPNGFFTDPMNLIFGVQRNIMIEYTKDIRARQFIIVLTARVAFAVEETNALCKYTNLVGSRTLNNTVDAGV
jgi:HK97 family phage major capsid protein